MVGQQQLQYHLAVLMQPFGVGIYLHAGLGHGGAGGFHAAVAVFYHAHAACAVYGKLAVVAEGGQLYACLAYNLQQVLLAVYLNGIAVYEHVFLVFHFAQSSLMA